MTSAPARALQMTTTARAAGRIVPPSVPAPYSTAVINGPYRTAPRSARRPPGADSASAAGASLILNDIPEPLVRPRVLDPLHLGGVRGPVYSVRLPGELAHSGDGRRDFLQVLRDRGVDGELGAQPLGDPGERGRHRFEQAREARQERVEVQSVLRRPGADALADRLGRSVDVVGHGALPFLVMTPSGSRAGPGRRGGGWEPSADSCPLLYSLSYSCRRLSQDSRLKIFGSYTLFGRQEPPLIRAAGTTLPTGCVPGPRSSRPARSTRRPSCTRSPGTTAAAGGRRRHSDRTSAAASSSTRRSAGPARRAAGRPASTRRAASRPRRSTRRRAPRSAP